MLPLVIAANNGHNQALSGSFLNMILTFEDFPPGPFGSFGPLKVSRDDIIAFAAEFDPQPMHLDDEAARHSMLGGLSGSGWHLCALMMRMMVDGFLLRSDTLGSPGVEEVRWLSPLRPDDELMLDVEVKHSRVSQSRPETGIVTFGFRVRNAANQPLLQAVCPIIMKLRHPHTA